MKVIFKSSDNWEGHEPVIRTMADNDGDGFVFDDGATARAALSATPPNPTGDA